MVQEWGTRGRQEWGTPVFALLKRALRESLDETVDDVDALCLR